MANPTDFQHLLGYARDFELATLTDDWSRLAPWFADDAVHSVRGGGPFGIGASGGAGVVAGLRESVARVDRRFDLRIPEIVRGPTRDGDAVSMRWRMVLRRAGLPDLALEGEHWAHFRGARIVELREEVEPGAGARVAAHLAAHAAVLRPPGSPFAAPSDPRDLEQLAAANARTLVRCYGAAKSRADVGAALALCSDGFVLDPVTLAPPSCGRAAVSTTLEQFFRAFPDYSVVLEGIANGPGTVAAWGRARMTLAGEWFGIAPTGKTAELAVFCVFGVANGQLTSERFFLDRATLFTQLGRALEAPPTSSL